jgi:phosphopantothenoylcysteine decarboxylase/phosphopantothenate--cysteine ligase
MHARMWGQQATQANTAALRDRGVVLVGPVEGRLASGDVGMGRLADQDDVLRAIRDALPGDRDLREVTVLVTAGGTREALDPVRFVGNRSSGLMGHALAAAAEARGAGVVLVTTTGMPVPQGVEVLRVETAEDMAAAVRAHIQTADMLVMAAAVADFRPTNRAERKMAKADMPDELGLEQTPDILASIGPEATGGRRLVKVGFAAETHDLLTHAQEKLMAKGLDLIVANDVSDPTIGMGSADNEVTVISRDGSRQELGKAPKEEIANRVLDAALAALHPDQSARPGNARAVS